MRAYVQTALAAGFAGLVAIVGCSNNSASCSAPSGGTFHVALSYSQTLPVDIFCDAGAIDASSCGAQPHPFDGAAWTIVVDGGSATVTTPTGNWSCAATAPRSAPDDEPDGSGQAGTGCYLLLACGQQAAGDAGAAQVQLQILAQGSSDVLALVHSVGSDCCTDEYTGSWH
jgi:hypothetical protein